jgi:hypothetical protein
MNVQGASEHNPHSICTWGPESQCSDCRLDEHLTCRFDRHTLWYFLGTFLLFLIPAVAGLVKSGFGWYVAVWVAYMFFFFNVWETHILCSHCPYYAENSSILHCLANYGSLKLWEFNPAPMSMSEKVQLLVGVAGFAGFPYPFLIAAGELRLGLFATAGLLVFVLYLRSAMCPRCVNFSCPFNAVAPELINEYLRRNPVMREAWEQEGWTPRE